VKKNEAVLYIHKLFSAKRHQWRHIFSTGTLDTCVSTSFSAGLNIEQFKKKKKGLKIVCLKKKAKLYFSVETLLGIKHQRSSTMQVFPSPLFSLVIYYEE